MSALIAKLHNWWITVPEGLRGILAYAVVTLVALGQAFNWTFPHSLTEAQAQLVAFAAIAAPVVVVIVRTQLAPWLVAWFLSTFNYARPTQLSKLTATQTDRWFKA